MWLGAAHDGRRAGTPESAGYADEDPALGVTCLYATYDPVLRHRVAARAGHIPPVQVTSDGKARLVDFPVGPPGSGRPAVRSRLHPHARGQHPCPVLRRARAVENHTDEIDVGLFLVAQLTQRGEHNFSPPGKTILDDRSRRERRRSRARYRLTHSV
ncbi:SpoIIE family protein phosphatase [Streptomyces sp. NPDC048309]|uniref:SpoIIE family protein phosphatase n=1 Tax=Streptomyces sp. NPDC048309 TaxID=3154618 RepID=UPI0033CFA4EA